MFVPFSSGHTRFAQNHVWFKSSLLIVLWLLLNVNYNGRRLAAGTGYGTEMIAVREDSPPNQLPQQSTRTQGRCCVSKNERISPNISYICMDVVQTDLSTISIEHTSTTCVRLYDVRAAPPRLFYNPVHAMPCACSVVRLTKIRQFFTIFRISMSVHRITNRTLGEAARRSNVSVLIEWIETCGELLWISISSGIMKIKWFPMKYVLSLCPSILMDLQGSAYRPHMEE